MHVCERESDDEERLKGRKKNQAIDKFSAVQENEVDMEKNQNIVFVIQKNGY